MSTTAPSSAGTNTTSGGSAPFRRLLQRFERVDRLIRAHVSASRSSEQAGNQFRGLCISEEDVDAVLARAPGLRWPAGSGDAGGSSSVHADGECRLDRLADLFRLSAFETDCLLICLAPEIDSGYESLYAYVQDDITKRRPGVDLLLDLLCSTLVEKLQRRRCFSADAPLLRHGLIQLFEDPAKPHSTLLGRYARIDDRIVDYLFECDDADARLSRFARWAEPGPPLQELTMQPERKERLARIAENPERLVLYLQGPYGSGRQAIAGAICRRLNLPVLVVDLPQLAARDESEFHSLLKLAAREAALQPAGLFLRGLDALLAEDRQRPLVVLLQEVAACRGPVFLGGEAAWDPAGELRGCTFLRMELSRPTYSERLALWKRCAVFNEGVDVAGLATKFRFTPGQIEDAAETARNLARWRFAEDRPGTAELFEAAKIQSNRKLSALALKIRPKYTWDQIVLPADRIQQLREICNCVKYRAVVYDQWGFDRKLSLGKGLNVLFAGPPGTGKTMAAEIIAGELGLDLYKIDLSSVVSKYIGETEKNLSRIFNEAETSNAILFFDEADALFGKRSEVRDSHDRYANIEVGYLLQRMEEYEGVVVLATNFRRNMDEAFVRRMHFSLEFPFPDAADRQQIWETIWPKEMPRRADVDLEKIARRFEIAGGNIRNIALGAAFLAADDGGAVNMSHVLHATRREYQKMGKVASCGEFDPGRE